MIASRAFLRPTVLAAVALLVLNDHVLKAQYPGVVTGKLSDVAGLIFFPLMLAAIAEQLGVRRGARIVQAAVIATAVAFTAFKLSASAGELYRVGLAGLQWPFRATLALVTGEALPAVGRAHLTQDPTDLVALVALALPLRLAFRTTGRRVLGVRTPRRRMIVGGRVHSTSEPSSARFRAVGPARF